VQGGLLSGFALFASSPPVPANPCTSNSLPALSSSSHLLSFFPQQDVITGDTLCDEKAPVLLERMEFPDPVIKVSLITEQ